MPLILTRHSIRVNRSTLMAISSHEDGTRLQALSVPDLTLTQTEPTLSTNFPKKSGDANKRKVYAWTYAGTPTTRRYEPFYQIDAFAYR